MGGYKDPQKQRRIVKNNFIRYVKELGRVPSYNEMRRTPDGYRYLSASSIERNFGSYSSLINELGLEMNNRPNQHNGKKQFTDEIILESIIEVCGKTQRFDCMFYHKNRKSGTPGLKAINLHFGSWRQALAKLHVTSNHVLGKKFVVSKDGHICDSVEESVVDDWLFDNNIRHIVHCQYPCSKLVMDFFLPDYNTVIEYAGLYDISNTKMGNDKREKYRQKLTIKESIAKENNYKFIMVKPQNLKQLDIIIDVT